MVQGIGQYLYDEKGTQYLDCINNVAHVGHGNKQVQMAVSRQLSLLNTNSRFLHDNLSLYAKRLTSLFPNRLSVCYLVNSGSEANDLAIRLARAHTGNKDIISVDGAYHGNLTSTMAISPYKNHKLHDYKQPKWTHIAPLPCSYRGQYNKDEFTEDEIGRLYAKSVDNVIDEAHTKGRSVITKCSNNEHQMNKCPLSQPKSRLQTVWANLFASPKHIDEDIKHQMISSMMPGLA